jgi:hypothetical protein
VVVKFGKVGPKDISIFPRCVISGIGCGFVIYELNAKFRFTEITAGCEFIIKGYIEIRSVYYYAAGSEEYISFYRLKEIGFTRIVRSVYVILNLIL